MIMRVPCWSWALPWLVLFGCNNDDAVTPTLKLEVQHEGKWSECKDATSCTLYGGQDSIRVTATYDDLEFSADDHPATPTWSLRLDGTAVDNLPGMSSIKGATEALTFQSGPYRLPGRPVSAVSIRVEGGSGYAAELSGIPVALSDPTVTVTGCGAGCTEFQAGASTAHVEVSAWVDRKTSVVLRSLVDDVPSGALESTFEGTDTVERKAIFDVAAPLVQALNKRNWRLEITADNVEIPSQELMLIEATRQVEVSGCGMGDSCEYPAGIGTATVTVTSGLEAGTKITLRSLLRGVQQDRLEAQLEGSAALDRKALFVVPVPKVFLLAGDTAGWRLEIASETMVFPAQELKLIEPSFQARFSECQQRTGDCELDPGTRLTLEVEAPADFAGRELTVRILVEDVPRRDAYEVTLDKEMGTSRTGEAILTAPEEPGARFTARVYFGNGYTRDVTMVTKMK
jgi:hypothetical protein